MKRALPIRQERRAFLVATALAALAAFMPAAFTFAQADDLVVGSWGGVWDDTVKQAVGSKFTAETGSQIQIVPGTSTDQFAKLIANPDSPPFDVLYIDLDAAAAGFSQGLFRKLDVATIPNLAKVYPNAIYGGGQAVAASFGAISIVYNQAKVPSVDSWSIFSDPANAGKYALNVVDGWALYMLPVFGKIKSGSTDDFDGAFDAIKAIAPGASQSLGDEALHQSFASGDVLFAPMYSGEAYVMYQAGQKDIRLAKPKEGMVAVPNLLVIPAHAKHPELAEKFINAALEESAQTTFATQYASAPSVTSVKLDPSMAQWMATGAQEVGALIQPNWVKLNAQRDALVQRWNTDIVPEIGAK
ncbi:putative spermidine/putrescine transport system substrate-binding protein [Rhizobium sp. BK313]|uniref:extracellular solute-binding protein n=1 Tax=Rhizobium sp. BK313 TaxID=2587081 RepID=UPI0010D1FF25|nr:extracellular solute-binding protein [Rhizobium sp. BK313]MBB3458021.1 putative spermidine/putrescine transport system substrate-binding protein [Rhizobium sp. BK313]